MGGILQVDSVLNNNTSNLITQTNSTTITIGSTGQTISLASGASSSGFGLTWNPTVQTTNFTASVGVGYMVNTTTAAITATLPAAPSIGDQVAFVDFNETAATNNIVLNPNGLKIDGTTENTRIVNGGEGVTILYTGTTRGWIPVSAANEGTTALSSQYNIDFLVIAGGGGGGADNGGGGGGGGYRTSTQAVNRGTTITVTVGDGGTGGIGTSGSDSSISGSGITTVTSAGGGRGGTSGSAPLINGASGGSGGGGCGGQGTTSGGTGNTPSTSPSQGNNGGGGITGTDDNRPSGGGGGAGAVGVTGSQPIGAGSGGAGTASSITGSSVTRAGGGGGGIGSAGATAGVGGSGGGGTGGYNTGNGTAGTANTGGGGGGGAGSGNYPVNGNDAGGAGGKGVVILSMATIHYTGNTSGSPTVTTSGSNTILQFNGSGSYSA
jgi:hypothetical protein